jgi:hypothetical protein
MSIGQVLRTAGCRLVDQLFQFDLDVFNCYSGGSYLLLVSWTTGPMQPRNAVARSERCSSGRVVGLSEVMAYVLINAVRFPYEH